MLYIPAADRNYPIYSMYVQIHKDEKQFYLIRKCVKLCLNEHRYAAVNYFVKNIYFVINENTKKKYSEDDLHPQDEKLYRI